MALLGNKKTRFKYEILETFEAGIELLGFEVKSLRAKRGSLEGAYVIVRGGETFLIGADIPAYQPKNAPKDYDSRRNRRLLLTRKEIDSLAGFESRKGLTIVPLSVYSKGKKIKISVGVGKGKKKYDKRETIKKLESEREVRRSLKYK
ncbi:SsrA-binding protein SmpB [Patescibacteria group bacterium]|nr:MAG: SsrA-binding protein SmpB [Patescibacteria group bacterium]